MSTPNLLFDYSDAIVLPSEEESAIALETLRSHLEDHEEDDMMELVDAALEHFRETLDTDMELIEHYVIERADSPRERLKQNVLRGSFEAAKIGAGVMAGLFIYDRVKRG